MKFKNLISVKEAVNEKNGLTGNTSFKSSPAYYPLIMKLIAPYKNSVKKKILNCSSTSSFREGVEKNSLKNKKLFNINYSKKTLNNFTEVSNQDKGSILGKIKSLMLYERTYSNNKIGEKTVSYKVLDVELSKTQLLIGLYLVSCKTYISLYLDDSSDESDISGLKETVMLILKNSLTSSLAVKLALLI